MEEPVELCRVDQIEAKIIQSILESAGIMSISRSDASPSVHSFTIDGLGEVRIFVSPDDLEEAQELIAREEPDGFEG
ncbi:MAG: putative signal transducing protein [bacterium]